MTRTSTSTFTTGDWEPLPWEPSITTALPTGHLRMTKTFTGEVEGCSVTQFSSAFDQERGTGHYVAMESFEGTVDGRRGAFNFVHAASTKGADRRDEYGVIVAGSGTGELEGIAGTVSLRIDPDGTHHLDFTYTL